MFFCFHSCQMHLIMVSLLLSSRLRCNINGTCVNWEHDAEEKLLHLFTLFWGLFEAFKVQIYFVERKQIKLTGDDKMSFSVIAPAAFDNFFYICLFFFSFPFGVFQKSSFLTVSVPVSRTITHNLITNFHRCNIIAKCCSSRLLHNRRDFNSSYLKFFEFFAILYSQIFPIEKEPLVVDQHKIETSHGVRWYRIGFVFQTYAQPLQTIAKICSRIDYAERRAKRYEKDSLNSLKRLYTWTFLHSITKSFLYIYLFF